MIIPAPLPLGPDSVMDGFLLLDSGSAVPDIDRANPALDLEGKWSSA